MSDPPLHADSDDDTEVGSVTGPIAGLPRWVKVSGIVVLVLAVLLVTMRLTGVGPGGHDPGNGMDHGLGDDVPAVSQEQAFVIPLSPVPARAAD
jgi:hypothetical protein